MIGRSQGILKYSTWLLFSIFLFYNCSDSSERDSPWSKLSDGADPPNAKIEGSVTDKRKPGVDTILISDMKFNPVELKVHKGDTVIWINNDLVAHCVTEVSNKSWTSSAISFKGSWKMVVNQSSDYYCAIHPVMKGKVVVE